MQCFSNNNGVALLGTTTTGTYMSAPSGNQSTNYPAPGPQRRGQPLTPWRPNNYYGTSKACPNTTLTQGMPEPNSARTQLTEMDSMNVPPVFAAARNALYTRYTQNDWLSSVHGNDLASNRVMNGAERLRLDTARVTKECIYKTKNTTMEVGKKLGERICDLNFWKTELLNETDQMITESNNLAEAKRMLEQTLAESANPLHISQECLYHREKRKSIDLVHDLPEKFLIKEVDTIKRAQERMRNVIDRTNIQLGQNRAAQHELEKDSGDKFVAENLDTVSQTLRTDSKGLAFHNGVHRIDNTISVPESWAKYSNSNIQRSQAERAASKSMRQEIECAINSCIDDMWKAWNDVNGALNARIQEITDSRNKTSTNLNRALQEIFDMERNITFLKKAIYDVEAGMQLAQTRLDTRLRRPNVELCRDAAQHTLVCEVGQITDTSDHLQHKLREAENALQALLRTKSALEQDLSIKNNSLFIDREKCMAMRKTFPISPRMVCT